MLACYARHSWNRVTVGSWAANATALDADVRQVAIVRLADNIEDALDHGLQLSGKGTNPARRIPTGNLMGLAEGLGFPTLGTALQMLLDHVDDNQDLAALSNPHAGSYLVCPPSWREKLLPRVRTLMGRMFGRC